MFSVFFWHSEGWTSRNEALLEAVLKRARVTSHPWLVACDADMSPVEFKVQKNRMHVVAQEKASTCRSKGAKGDWIEKVYDYAIAYNSPKGKISQMEVVWKTPSRGRTKRCLFWRGKRKGDAEMERAEVAKGVAGVQWRKVARKKHKRKEAEKKER